jgi:hypothetical protein
VELPYTSARFEGVIQTKTGSPVRFWSRLSPGPDWFELKIDGKRVLCSDDPPENEKGATWVRLAAGIHHADLSVLFEGKVRMPSVGFREGESSSAGVLGAADGDSGTVSAKGGATPVAVKEEPR